MERISRACERLAVMLFLGFATTAAHAPVIEGAAESVLDLASTTAAQERALERGAAITEFALR